MLELIFWLSIIILIYVYAGFPLLLVAVGTLRNRKVMQGEITPRISLIIAAYNEEEHIGERVRNALELDYPADLLEILVASDGSIDRTEEIVSGFCDDRVKLLSLPRQGKIHALNAAVAAATGEVLVFSDATSIYSPAALRMLVRNLADPSVGGVCGRPQFIVNHRESESTAESERIYFVYDTFLKQMESRTGSVVSAAGCMHAVRASLYRPIPAYVTDDFAISTAVVEQGYRLVFESEAVAFEEPAPKSAGEFHRKVRMMTRGFRSLIYRRRLFNPFRYGFYSLSLLSHKLLRRIVPVFLLILFTVSLWLAPASFIYAAAFIAQLGFYGFALAGFGLTRTPLGRIKVIAVPFYYCVGNAAALVALWKVCRGCRIEQWQPQRQAVAGD